MEVASLFVAGNTDGSKQGDTLKMLQRSNANDSSTSSSTPKPRTIPKGNASDSAPTLVAAASGMPVVRGCMCKWVVQNELIRGVWFLIVCECRIYGE